MNREALPRVLGHDAGDQLLVDGNSSPEHGLCSNSPSTIRPARAVDNVGNQLGEPCAPKLCRRRPLPLPPEESRWRYSQEPATELRAVPLFYKTSDHRELPFGRAFPSANSSEALRTKANSVSNSRMRRCARWSSATSSLRTPARSPRSTASWFTHRYTV